MTALPTTQGHAVHTICTAHPNTQAIYLYGTWGTEYQRQDSDLDIAVLLPVAMARTVDSVAWFDLSTEITLAVRGVEYTDLINLRRVSTSFQAEILRTGRLLHCADHDARIDFETLTVRMYHKLNQERAGIRAAIIARSKELAAKAMA